jgi:hypothetical protein
MSGRLSKGAAENIDCQAALLLMLLLLLLLFQHSAEEVPPWHSSLKHAFLLDTLRILVMQSMSADSQCCTRGNDLYQRCT